MPSVDETAGLVEGLLDSETAPGVKARLREMIGDGPFTVYTLHESTLLPYVMRLGDIRTSAANAGGHVLWVEQQSGTGLFMPEPFREYEKISFRFADGRLEIASVRNGTTHTWVVLPLRAPKAVAGLPVGERSPGQHNGPLPTNEVHGGNVDYYAAVMWLALVGHDVLYGSNAGDVPIQDLQTLRIQAVWIGGDRLYVEYLDKRGEEGCHMLRLRRSSLPVVPYGATLTVEDTGAFHFETLGPGTTTHYVYFPLP